jgi:hypothetical protein
VQEAEDSLGYRFRETRCEGRYSYEPFAQEPLRLVGFTERFADYPLNGRESLHVEWSLPQAAPVALEATSLTPRKYYRMDASLPRTARSFSWPLDVLAGLKYKRTDIGVLARARLPVGDRVHDVLVPLRIRLARTGDRATAYTLVALPGTSLRRLHVTVARIQLDGSQGALLVQREWRPPFRRIGEQAIEVIIDRPRERGIYAVEIGAEPDSDFAEYDSLRVWFYSD